MSDSNNNTNNNSGNSSIWSQMERYVSLAGKWSWVWPFIAILVTLILVIIALGVIASYSGAAYNAAVGTLVWDFISMGVMLFLVFYYVKPNFAKKCANKEWQALVDDVFTIGSIRIPKMLIFGIIFEIFSYWGGALIMAPAVLIILFAPVTITWKK